MREPSLKSQWRGITATITLFFLVFFAGCVRPDKDVTADPYYNFSSFTNTVWKTKTRTAIVSTKGYVYAPGPTLLPSDGFDPTDPHIKQIVELPPGTRLRIRRLWQDQGNWGGVRVEAVIEDEPNAQKAVILDRSFLTNVCWSSTGPTTNKTWGVNPGMLEKP
jgi:hypothetical protein